jgi:hypothetical protein
LGITLNVMSGASAGRKLRLATGQKASFGKTEWSDNSFPQDKSMGDVHFLIDCTQGLCLLRDMGSESGTFVDGERVTETQLHTSNEIKAGQTVFSVSIDGESAAIRASEGDSKAASAAAQPEKSAPPPPKSLMELCEYLKFDAAASALAKDLEIAPMMFAKRLADEKQYMPAMRLTAHQLTARLAVWWGALCTRESVGEHLSAKDVAALDAAVQWVKTGKEADRRSAQAAAEATQFDTAAGWVALAAFWAEGSLAPIGMDDVVPDERLTGQAITGALLMAAVQVSPLKSVANYQRYLAIAEDVFSGKAPAPKS